MKHFHPFAIVLFGAALTAHFACNDPTVIGSDLLSGDQLDIDFTDTLTLHTYNISEDSVLTYDPDIFAVNFLSFPVGDFDDPVFGRTKSSVYAQVNLNISNPDFAGAIVDSMVLMLPYQADRIFGNTSETFSMAVYRLAEDLPDSIVYYSNQTYERGDLIGSVDYIPAPEDSVKVYDAAADDFNTIVPHLRIRLDQAFANSFIESDSLIFAEEDAFLEFFKGFHLEPTSSNGGLVSFNFRSSEAGMRVYYHVENDSTEYHEYLFPIFSTNIVTAHFEHDYSGAPVEDFIGETSPVRDSLLFVQGMSGISFVIEVPYASNLKNLVVNKAEFEFPILTIPGDDPTFDPVDQIVIFEILEDESTILVNDVLGAISRVGSDDFQLLFGGDIESDNTYKLNISSHFQDMIQGLVTKKMLVTVYIKPEKVSRVVLGGPANSTAPAKLNLTFTNY